MMHLNQAGLEFLRGYFSTHKLEEKTRVAYSCDLAQFQTYAGDDLCLLSLTGNHIEDWTACLRKRGYSPSSIRRKIVVLRIFCSYWVRKGVLPESPFWRVKLSFGRVEQLPRTLTYEEMRALLAHVQRNYSIFGQNSSGSNTTSPHSYRRLRNLALVDLLFATGMRVGEVSALDVEDFQAEEKVFKVRGKGRVERLAYIVDEKTIQIQREHVSVRKHFNNGNSALFLNSFGKRLSTQGITNVIALYRREARIDRHVTPHMLWRHESIGKFKAVQALVELAEIAPSRTEIVAYVGKLQEILASSLIKGASACLIGIDNDRGRAQGAKALRELKIPAIFYSISADTFTYEVFVQELSGPCWACANPERYKEGIEHFAINPCSRTPGVSDPLLVAAGLCSYALDSLVMRRPRYWNFRHGHLHGELPETAKRISRDPACSLCRG